MGHDFSRFKEVADEVQFCVQKQLQTNSSGVEFPRASEPVALIFHSYRKRNGPAKAVLLLRWALFIFKVQCQGTYHETAEKLKTNMPRTTIDRYCRRVYFNLNIEVFCKSMTAS